MSWDPARGDTSDPRWVLRRLPRDPRPQVPRLNPSPQALLAVAIAILILLGVIAGVALARRDDDSAASDSSRTTASSGDGQSIEMLPSWAQQSGTIELQAGSPDGLPRRFDVGCPFPAPSVAAYEDESSFLLVVYAEGAAQEDVLPFLAHAPASEGWTFSTSEEPDPSAWSLGALRFEREGSPAVALHFYDPSGGDQLRLGEEYGVQGPWIEAQFEVEGFG